VLTVGVVVLLLLAAIGQIARDRSMVLALLFYLPLLPIGLWALVQDLVFGGRCLPWPRFGLAGLGCAAIGWSLFTMISLAQPDKPSRNQFKLLHWNVHWGGGKNRNEDTWTSLMHEINHFSPDVVVLSEAPQKEWVAQLADKNQWSFVQCQHPPENLYWYSLVVCCRGEVQREYDEAIPNGHVMSVLVNLGGQPVRLLVVDGESNPRLSRLDMLAKVDAICQLGMREGKPVDILAGDFNTPRRSIGFDSFSGRQRYSLASDKAFGWRGTFPAALPLFDIDHVWVRADFPVLECAFFANPNTDHRGQLVRFSMPDEE
jgi:endonuclease/exonuclease/phosphatase (EEP) superfamily protein YafD